MQLPKTNNHSLIILTAALTFCVLLFILTSFSEVALATNQEVLPSHLGTTKIAPELITKSEAKGPVHVLVKLDVDFKPEGLLNEPQQIMRQRGKIGSTQKRVQQKVLPQDVSSIKQFEYIPYLALTASKETLENLIASNEVVSIQEDVPVPPSLAESVPLINADDSWTAGYTGSGQTVAILDTGVDYNHTFLSGKMVSEGCYSNFWSTDTSVCPNGLTVDTSAGSGLYCDLGTVGCDHGTHVAGIAVGKGGSFSGVAKDAQLIAIQVFTEFANPTCSLFGLSAPCALTYTADRILALERVYSLRTTYNIAAVNMSLGGGIYSSACDSDGQKPAIDNLRTVGIATVIASGNDGSSTGISSPACISSAISVGSTTKLDAVSAFSNSASILDLLAPGSSINSAIAQGTFASWSGTSMATPHVAGAWAVLKSRFPLASVSTILSALVDTGTQIFDARNSLTHLRIDVNGALGALEGPSRTWYLAEGLSNDTVSTYILVQNPNGTVANLTVTYMIEGGENVVANHAVQANKRYTIGAVNDVGLNKSFSTKIVSDQEVIVERAMYFPQGGHDSIGVTVPSKTWYLAEGLSNSTVSTYILIQNPNDTVANLTVTYMIEGGENIVANHAVQANKRYTIGAVGDVGLGKSFSTKITSDQRVVVERAMYFPQGGHVSIAARIPSQTWYLAEGLSNSTVSTYILIQNPNDTAANLTVTYMIQGGENIVVNHTVQANKRYTIGAVGDVGLGKSFSTRITSDRDVVVERAMYFPEGGHDSTGITALSQTWYLAEGLSNSTVSTYILIQNPNGSVANLTVTYMIEGGVNIVANHTVQANKRYTIGAVGDVGLDKSFSTKITSNQPVAVERAMYFPQGGHVSIGVAE